MHVKVRGREEDRESVTDPGVITITEDCDEERVVEEIMRFLDVLYFSHICSYAEF